VLQNFVIADNDFIGNLADPTAELIAAVAIPEVIFGPVSTDSP
jgi:hypothetical protein